MKKSLIIIIVALIIIIAAVLTFRKEAWKNERKAPDLYYRALNEYSRGNFQDAERLMEGVRKRYRSRTWEKRWNFVLGCWFLDAGRSSEAFRYFERSYSERDPLYHFSLFFGARAALGAGRKAEAERMLLTLIQKGEKERFFRDSLFLLADTKIESRDYSGARTLLLKHMAQLQEPYVPVAKLKLALAYEKEGDRENALELYKEIYCHYPFSAEADDAKKRLDAHEKSSHVWNIGDVARLLRRGDQLEDGGRHEDAFQLYMLIEKMFPGRAVGGEISFREARTLFNLKKYADALGCLNRARMSGYQAPDASLLMARIELKQGKTRAFIRDMKILSETKWGTDIGQSATLQLAEYYDMHGEWGNALPLYMRYLSSGIRAERMQKAQWRAACILYMRGRYSDSLIQLNKMIMESDNPYGIPASYWAGRCHEKLKNPHKAEELYSDVVRRAEMNYYGSKAGERLRLISHKPLGDLKSTEGAGKKADWNAIHARDLYETEELLTMNLRNLAFQHLRYVCSTMGKSEAPALLQSANIAMQYGEKQEAVEFLKSALELPLSTPVPDALLMLMYPRDNADQICPIARSFSLDCDLILSLILQESAFNPAAMSRAGAMGLMQIMPSTGKEIAEKMGNKAHDESMLFETDYNIRIGCNHFSRLVKKFNGSLELALAAYNAGEANVEKWERWLPSSEIDLFVDNIPLFETRNYVKRVLSNYTHYRELYGR